ncbi:MAG: Cof-type HAD-IIB family hydrolase [Oscillospiraceae bacterium]|nr:Cof-type HAD-IIB family hydrolase [Oscillospiraceae bacterium]
MIQKLSDILVVSDVDNTLLTSQEGIPSCNVETIRLFTSLGGKFALATGRSIQSLRKYEKRIAMSAPAILYNGGVLYDFEEEQVLCYCALPQNEALRALQEILYRFPQVGAEIMADNQRTYVVASNEYTFQHKSRENQVCFYADAESVPGEWYKILFACDAALRKHVQEFIQGRYPKLNFTASSEQFLEMIPQGISKGVALKKLCRLVDVPLENTFAIGDYDNDLELLKTAGHAVAVGNATPVIKENADILTGSCQDGGVAQFLYELIRQYT